jgi:hypothetical protein
LRNSCLASLNVSFSFHASNCLCVSVFFFTHWCCVGSLSYCVSSCLSTSSCDYVDISSIIPGFCRDPLNILIVLIPLFLNLPQKCWAFLCIMVCCTTVHTCHRWKWTFPCIMSWMLEVVAHYWTSTSSKSSSTSSSTSISSSISSWCIVLRHLIILHGVILWCVLLYCGCACCILCCIVVWRWYLVKLRCNFSLSSFIPAPYRYLKFFPSSGPLSYNLYHHDPLICKNCSMNSWVLSDTFASLDNDMDHAHVSYRSRTMVLLLEKGLVACFHVLRESWALILVVSL